MWAFRHTLPGLVFPAHAGVIRRSTIVPKAKACFPRTRGGDPTLDSCGMPDSGFSPHARRVIPLARVRGQLAAALALELGGSAQTPCDITIVVQGGAAIAVLCPARGAIE